MQSMPAFTCLILMLSLPAAASVTVHGEARSLGEDQLLYTEDHLISENQHEVSYRFPDGKLLADKNMHYQQGFQTPSFELYDYRFGRLSGSKWEEGKWLLWQQQESGDRKEKRFEHTGDLVIDSGFNYLVAEHYDELANGKTLEFTFAITDPPMGIDMKIGRVPCEELSFEDNKKPHLCLKSVSRNPLLRWFVPDIYLAYIKDTRMATPLLVLYQGPSNLPDDADKGQNVRIEYRYQLENKDIQ